jgi:hypothetical protein
MHSSTNRILGILKRHSLSPEEVEALDKEISEATSAAWAEAQRDYDDPCGCGQPSCRICN